MQKGEWIEKLKVEIVQLQRIENILMKKNPAYPFLYPTVGNALYAMANLLAYCEGKSPYIAEFREDYFRNLNITMHKTFFHDLHISTEDGLRKIISENDFQITISREKQARSIVESIRKKISDTSMIDKELKSIIILAGKHPTFNDYLNTVLNNIPKLDRQYKVECGTFFDGYNIIRNKVAHSDVSLSEEEKARLISAKLGKAINSEGTGLWMTFEGYKWLLTDIIRFFDNLYAKL